MDVLVQFFFELRKIGHTIILRQIEQFYQPGAVQFYRVIAAEFVAAKTADAFLEIDHNGTFRFIKIDGFSRAVVNANQAFGAFFLVDFRRDA